MHAIILALGKLTLLNDHEFQVGGGRGRAGWAGLQSWKAVRLAREDAGAGESWSDKWCWILGPTEEKRLSSFSLTFTCALWHTSTQPLLQMQECLGVSLRTECGGVCTFNSSTEEAEAGGEQGSPERVCIVDKD